MNILQRKRLKNAFWPFNYHKKELKCIRCRLNSILFPGGRASSGSSKLQAKELMTKKKRFRNNFEKKYLSKGEGLPLVCKCQERHIMRVIVSLFRFSFGAR